MFVAMMAGAYQSSVVHADPAALPWNGPAVRESCPEGHNAVWTEYPGGQACMRFFTGGDVEGADTVVIRLNGDHTSYVKRDPNTIPDNTVAAQNRIAQGMSESLHLPVVVIARPGMYGSSGDHLRRRSEEEFLAINAALDRIKQLYGFKRVVLSGQSGGATAGAAVLTLGRTDVRCAVLTSGAFALLERAEFIRKRDGFRSDPESDVTGVKWPYDPIDHIFGMVTDPNRNIVVIGNPMDRTAQFEYQVRYADALKAHGHNVRLLEWPAQPPNYHVMREPLGVVYLRQCGNLNV